MSRDKYHLLRLRFLYSYSLQFSYLSADSRSKRLPHKMMDRGLRDDSIFGCPDDSLGSVWTAELNHHRRG